MEYDEGAFNQQGKYLKLNLWQLLNYHFIYFYTIKILEALRERRLELQRGAEEQESQQESFEGLVTDKERKRKKKDTDSNVWDTYRVQCARKGF